MNDNIIIFGILVLVILFIAYRNRKEYRRSEPAQNLMVERQKESLDTLKDIQITLKEISQKLDKK